jgi:hypothetical protein
MSYNGSGTFQINTSGQPVVAGTVISSTAFNALTADLATGLSTAITKDGQTTTTARIPFAQGISDNTLTASSAVATDGSKALVSVTNTGTGNNVLATSPTLVTPILGTPASGNLVNCTGLDYDGFKNRIINGAMVIDQRNAGAEVNPAVSGTYYLDRYVAQSTAASKFKIGQNAGTVTPPTGFIKYLGCTSLSAYTAGASESFNVQQRIEGLNVADLAWGTASAATVTLSFWAYSSLTGTFGGVVNNAAVSTRSYPFTYTISASNTWEYKTITIAGDTSGTWLTTNDLGILVVFSLGAGATVSGTSGVWASANYRSATGATSVVGTNGATFYITGVQLEKGSTATSFDYRPYGTELNLCQRYYMLSPAMLGRWISTTNCEMMIQLTQTMRVAPALSLISAPSVNEPGVALRTVSAVAASAGSNLGGEIGVTTAAATNGAIGFLSAGAFNCNAEL